MSHDPSLHPSTIPSRPSRPPPPPPLSRPSSPSHRPTLTSVLHNAAPAPFSLSRFAHFLHEQHCIEILAFTQAIADYRAAYHAHFPRSSAAAAAHPPPHSLWRDIIDTYVSTRAAHQVNLHGRVREALLAADCGGGAPEPDVLQEAEESMLELLGDVFAHFVERTVSSPVTPATSRAASPVMGRRGSRGCVGEGVGDAGGECMNDGEGGQEGFRRGNDAWSAKMHRNLSFARELAAKAGNLMRGREGDGGRRRG